MEHANARAETAGLSIFITAVEKKYEGRCQDRSDKTREMGARKKPALCV